MSYTVRATLQHSYSSACLIGHAVVNAIADAEDAFSWNTGNLFLCSAYSVWILDKYLEHAGSRVWSQ